MDMNEPIPQEAYYPLSVLVLAIGAGFSISGMRNVLEGYSNNDPAARELGKRLLKIGGNFAFLSASIQKGILPAPEIMEYLAER